MNPLDKNPLKTRDDFAASVVQLWEPLKPRFSPGCARVSLAATGAHFTVAAAELEGYARPLFGLAPLAAGGLPFADWDMMAKGFANGMDPSHPEYWGDIYDMDQRLVESAAIGFGLLLAKDKLWDPLPQDKKDNIARWLRSALTRRVADNNWHFFHVFGSLALSHCGVDHDLTIREAALDRLEEFYVDEGWYSDGHTRRYDHYVPFAMHFYGLIYAKLAPHDEARAERFRERARIFARNFRTWFASDGASVPYGRSMTYRFAQAAFWGALAYADVEALPWGQIRSLWSDNIRWWAKKDYFDRDGISPVGYLYPNYLMSERYNSPGSPYWSMKAYLPLALPGDHPFWTAEEQPLPSDPSVTATAVNGTLSFEAGGSRVLFPACSEMRFNQRAGPEKYGKFAYSSGFGFSIDHDRTAFLACAFDNMIAFSKDCRSFSMRSDIEDARIGEDWLWSRWSPEHGIEVETLLLATPPWHVRIHRIVSDASVYTVEGGFAIERTDAEPLEEMAKGTDAVVRAQTATSFARDLSDKPRRGRVLRAIPNSSLYYPRTYVPQFLSWIGPGETWLGGAYAAGFEVESARWMETCPGKPDRDALLAMVSTGRVVKGLDWREAAPSEAWIS